MNPRVEFSKHSDDFTEAEVGVPPFRVGSQSLYRLFYAPPSVSIRKFPDFLSETFEIPSIPYAKVGRLVRFSRLRIQDWLKQGGSR